MELTIDSKRLVFKSFDSELSVLLLFCVQSKISSFRNFYKLISNRFFLRCNINLIIFNQIEGGNRLAIVICE
jgi:hypothetical protein